MFSLRDLCISHANEGCVSLVQRVQSPPDSQAVSKYKRRKFVLIVQRIMKWVPPLLQSQIVGIERFMLP